jgi:hypothetical protein
MEHKVPNLTASQIEERKEEIRKIAKKVYDISFDYHLTHAVFGSDGLIVLDRKEAGKVTDELNKSLQEAARNNNESLMKKLMKKIEIQKSTIRKRYKVFVDYSGAIKDAYSGRVIVVDGDKLRITLPEKLTEDIKSIDNVLQKENIEKIRKIMAHELGHIVLHADMIPAKGMIGSNELSHLDWEAVVFEEEMLRLFKAKDTEQAE